GFGSAGGVDPTATGIVIELRGPDGALLYRAVVPAFAIRTNRSATRYRYVRARTPNAAADGLPQHLTLRRDGDRLAFSLDATMPDAIGQAASTRVALAIRLGAACARDAGLVCAAETRLFDCTPS